MLSPRPDHHAGLSGDGRIHLLGAFQQAQRSLVTRSRAGHAIQPRHGFGVVIQDVGLGVHHYAQRLFQTLEIGDQHFDPAVGNALRGFP